MEEDEMTIKEYENLFQDEEHLTQLINKYQESFDRVNHYSDLFRNGAIYDPEETDKAMKDLTGIFMSLSIVATMAETEKMNREVRFYNQAKMKVENEGGKAVVAQLDRQSSAHVASWRKVRNIFQAYRDVCDRVISVCQSSLKSLEKEKRLTK